MVSNLWDIFTGGFILYNYIFIRIILDFYLNHIFSLNFPVIQNSIFTVKIFLVINLFIVWLFILIANYYDLKFGIIPNKINLILFIYGLFFNSLLALLFNNPYILIFSLVLTSFVALISFLLWHIGFWGGGDLKFFIGLTLSLSFLDLNYLNLIKINIVFYNLELPFFSQNIVYPKVFSILFNGILIAFIFLFLYLINNIIKFKKLKYYSILSIIDFKSMINQLTTKEIYFNNLTEGLILDKNYFNNERVYNKINELNHDDFNLKANKDEYGFFFSSLNGIGLTKKDIDLINDLYKDKLIKNPNMRIKIGIPFIPFLTIGFLCFLVFGDIISIISTFIKFLF